MRTSPIAFGVISFSCIAALGPVAAMAGGDEPFAISEIRLIRHKRLRLKSLIGEGFFFYPPPIFAAMVSRDASLRAER